MREIPRRGVVADAIRARQLRPFTGKSGPNQVGERKPTGSFGEAYNKGVFFEYGAGCNARPGGQDGLQDVFSHGTKCTAVAT